MIKGILLFLILFFASKFTTAQDRALFFAINNYENKALTSLKEPIKDAQEIASKLEELYGFTSEVIPNPTLEQMAQKLNTYQENYQNGVWSPESRLLIFLSGHGTVDNRNGYFLPVDAHPDRLFSTGFAYAIWRPFIDNIACKHILVAIDACYSGTFDPSWWEGKRKIQGRPGELDEGDLLIVNHEKYTTRYFFTSATENKTPDKSKFAKKFKEALLSRGEKDGILTSTEMFTYLEVANPTPHRGEFGADEPESSFLLISNRRGDGENHNQFSVSKEEQKAWDKALDENTIPAYQDYLAQYPEGVYKTLAENIVSKINAWTAPDKRYSYAIDKDKNVYPVLKMKDGKEWMVENLKVKVPKSYCYEDDLANCDKYGRLYTWEAAKKACASLEGGWRLPTDEEWKKLGESYGGIMDYQNDVWVDLGNAGTAYNSLISNGNSGFAAQLGGRRGSNGSYYNEGTDGNYWSSTARDGDYAWSYYFGKRDGKLYRISNLKTYARSVRCLQD